MASRHVYNTLSLSLSLSLSRMIKMSMPLGQLLYCALKFVSTVLEQGEQEEVSSLVYNYFKQH